jgi:hypothetical protein
MLDDLLWFGFDLIIEMLYPLQILHQILRFFEVRLLNSDKLPTIRLFISCTALLVNVMARMLRYVIILAKMIFRYSLQAHSFTRPADASYMAKDGRSTFPKRSSRNWIYFMFQISLYFIICIFNTARYSFLHYPRSMTI